MSSLRALFRFFGVFLVVSSLTLGGCSYIPWLGGEDEDDLAFEDEFPFEDEEAARSQDAKTTDEEDFFVEEEGLGGEGDEGGNQEDFASIDQTTDTNEIKTDLENLQSQQEALISKIRELEEIIATMEPRINATQERLEGSLASSSGEAEFLEPEVEELKLQVARLNEEIRVLKSKPNSAPAQKKRGKRAVPKASRMPPEYDKALNAYRQGNYDESILLFQNLALANPPPNLQDNIVFWIGSNYVKLEMYDDAINQFQTVLSRYPRGNKVHDSRYLLGLSYYQKGETSRAVDILQAALRSKPPAEVRQKIERTLAEIQ